MKRFVLASLALAACSADESVNSCTSGTAVCLIDGGFADRLSATDQGPTVDTAPNELVAISIDPATSTLVVPGTTPVILAYAARGTLGDGTTIAIGDVTWSVPVSSIGTIDSNTGVYIAMGAAGGRVTVSAQVPSPRGGLLTATATLDVQVARTYFTPGTPSTAAMNFMGTPVVSPTEAPTLDYPLDGAVMPANVFPPDVQWEGGNAGDIYRVTVARADATIVAYVQHTGAAFTYDWPIDAGGWQTLVSTDSGTPITVTVDRWDATTMVLASGPTVSLHIAQASLSGAIYFWDLSQGIIRRLDPITSMSTAAVPSPPTDPSGAGGNQCIACHAISRDGRYMAVEMWGGGDSGAVFDLTDPALGMNPAPTVVAPMASLDWLFATWSPDSTQIVINQNNTLSLLDVASGSILPGSNLPTSGSAHPEWSPSGRSLAYISNTDGTWGVDFTNGDLTVVPSAGAGAFGTPRVIHPAMSSPGGPVDAHPSFSPDSEWLVFQHGTNSRSGNTVGAAYQIFPGRLEIIGASGGEPTPLANANGPGGMDGYWPNFSPFDTGGYYWLAFYARRDYGNAQAGSKGTQYRQIWITAISDHPTPGTDPSSVPYWMPGQDHTVQNMSAFWAPAACRSTGTHCETDSECCSGTCMTSPDGTFSCMPATMQCRMMGQTCSSDSDCCAPLTCAGNVCLAAPM